MKFKFRLDEIVKDTVKKAKRVLLELRTPRVLSPLVAWERYLASGSDHHMPFSMFQKKCNGEERKVEV